VHHFPEAFHILWPWSLTFWTKNWHISYSRPEERWHRFWFICAFCIQVRSLIWQGMLKSRDLTSWDHQNCGDGHRETGQVARVDSLLLLLLLLLLSSRGCRATVWVPREWLTTRRNSTGNCKRRWQIWTHRTWSACRSACSISFGCFKMLTAWWISRTTLLRAPSVQPCSNAFVWSGAALSGLMMSDFSRPTRQSYGQARPVMWLIRTTA